MPPENSKPPVFYAGAFLYNPKTQSVLLHLRDEKAAVHPNQWGFFGELSEGSETPEECVIRELKEELNINIKKNQLRKLCDYLNEQRGTWRHVFFIESDLEKSAMRLGEGADFDWIPLAKVFEYNLTDKTRKDLATFCKKL